jgi:cellobiose phosphorylase
MGRNTWLTGTASWTYVAGTQWILGIRPTYQGLKIAPVIPDHWPGYRAIRFFRGVRYTIMVSREGSGSLVLLQVDGTPVQGNVVPIPAAGKTEVTVRVTLGSP